MKIADCKNSSNLWIKCTGTYPNRFETSAYLLWHSMSARCSLNNNSKPSYAGCSLSENFSNFQYFADWVQNQIGYKEYKFEMDKDILVHNNKVYSEEVCVFIPADLNKFLTLRNACRGNRLIGCFKKQNKFAAGLTINSRNKWLGTFDTEMQAHLAYVEAKEAEAFRWYERLSSGEFTVDPRVIERMRVWKYKV
jgi:hypothetical protein